MFKVMIIEDEKMIRLGLKNVVNWLSLDCVVVGEATNGDEGIQKLDELKPDIVLLDINMPIKDGLEFLEETVDKHVFSTIIISGYDEFNYAKKAIAYDVSEYLLKPVEYDKLYEAIERAKESVKIKKQYELIKNKIETPDNIQLIKEDFWELEKDKSQYVANMLAYIKNNYHLKITMDDLVKEIGMSATFLNNHFRENTSYTFNEFLNRYRIQKAIKLIKLGDKKISTIATEVGFGSYRYFIKVFKKYTNALPSDFHNYFIGQTKQD